MDGATTGSKPLAHVRGRRLTLDPAAPRTVVGSLAAAVARWPEGALSVWRAAGEPTRQTYAELWERSARIAAGLCGLGVGHNTRVVLLTRDAPDFVAALWGCFRGGFTAVPLSSAATLARREDRGILRHAIERLEQPVILVDAGFEEFARSLQTPGRARIIRLAEAEASLDPWRDRPSADPFCLIPTSGSTGHLKLAALRQDTVHYRRFGVPGSAVAPFAVMMGSFPFDSITGWRIAFPACRDLVQLPPDMLAARPLAFLDAVERFAVERADITSSSAAMVLAAQSASTDGSRRWDLKSLRRVSVGAETIVRPVMRDFAALLAEFGARRDIIRVGCGSTETGPLVAGRDPLASRPGDSDDAPVSLGACSADVELRVVGEDGAVLAEDDVGEVQVHCPRAIFSGYWGEPEASRACFTADGWYRTGDLGRLSGGELTLHGRAKDVLIVNGRKYSLAEIDAVAQAALGTRGRAFSCAVHWPGEATERLAVAIVPGEPGAAAAPLADDIRRAVARRFALQARPLVVAPPHAIPLTASGKLRRHELARRVRSGMFDAAPSTPAGPAAGGPDPSGATRLADLWREALGLAADFDPRANFFELGGDSLRSVRLLASVEERFGGVPAHAFYDAPTFAGLLRLVEGGADRGASPPAATPGQALASDIESKLRAFTAGWAGETPGPAALIRGLNRTGSRRPLFWCLQTSNELAAFARHLGPDQPVYGMRSGHLAMRYTPANVAALARRYVDEIRSIDDTGPYLLAGICQGCTITVEMARQLGAAGRGIALLALVDTNVWPLFDGRIHRGKVAVFAGSKSRFNPYRRFSRPDMGWRKLFPDGLRFELLPSDYARFDTDAPMAAFAPRLRQALDWALTDPPQSSSAAADGGLAPMAYEAAFEAPTTVCLEPGEGRTLSVGVTNAGPATWTPGATSGLALANHWLSPLGEIVVWADGHAFLPRELAPGATTILDLCVRAPSIAGRYLVEIDLVEEGVTWFKDKGVQCAYVEVTVAPRPPLAALWSRLRGRRRRAS